MKALFLLTITVCYNYITTYGQGITIPYDVAAVTVDGVMNNTEWENASKKAITISGTDSVQVYYKHDMNALYFAFTGKLESANALFPEVLIDPQHVKGSAWVTGQWWFHVSATDCENNGSYGVYNNCQLVQPDWEGANNFAMGAPYTDTVEIKIPFSKIGFNPATQTGMGIVFLVTNTATTWKLWPSTADKSVPDTWSDAVISKTPVGVSEAQAGKIKVYPNPATSSIIIEGVSNGSKVKFTDITGRVVIQQHYTGSPVNIAALLPGVYHLHVYTNGQWTTGKTIQKL